MGEELFAKTQLVFQALGWKQDPHISKLSHFEESQWTVVYFVSDPFMTACLLPYECKQHK